MRLSVMLCFAEKGKKLYKIASKLNPRKKSISRNGVMQEKTGSNGSGSSQQYQPLIDGVCSTNNILQCISLFLCCS